MSKSKLKALISEKFGFKQSKIILLEAHDDGTYIMFDVCGVRYQAYFDFANGLEKLYMCD